MLRRTFYYALTLKFIDDTVLKSKLVQSFHLRDAEFAAEKSPSFSKGHLGARANSEEVDKLFGVPRLNSFLKGQQISNFDLNIKHNSKALTRKSIKSVDE